MMKVSHWGNLRRQDADGKIWNFDSDLRKHKSEDLQEAGHGERTQKYGCGILNAMAFLFPQAMNRAACQSVSENCFLPDVCRSLCEMQMAGMHFLVRLWNECCGNLIAKLFTALGTNRFCMTGKE